MGYNLLEKFKYKNVENGDLSRKICGYREQTRSQDDHIHTTFILKVYRYTYVIWMYVYTK